MAMAWEMLSQQKVLNGTECPSDAMRCVLQVIIFVDSVVVCLVFAAQPEQLSQVLALQAGFAARDWPAAGQRHVLGRLSLRLALQLPRRPSATGTRPAGPSHRRLVSLSGHLIGTQDFLFLWN